MQTTLLGLAIAFILALIAALVGPYFIDWNQFRPQFEAEASQVLGAPVRVAGQLDARLLPTPTLRLTMSPSSVPVQDGPLRILVTSLSGAERVPFTICPPVTSVPEPPMTI